MFQTTSQYSTSSILSPNINSVVQAIATILHAQLFEDKEAVREVQKDSDLYYFSEEKYIDSKGEEFDEEKRAQLMELPTAENIFDFVKAFYDCAQFSLECCIVSLVYINRMIAFTGMPLTATNWRPLILCSMLIAQKVWDDKHLSNADFAFIYPFFTTEEVNMLEKKFLELLQYNVTVKSSLYAKYYYELRALYKNENEFPIAPLNPEQAKKLETKSNNVELEEKEKQQKVFQTCDEKFFKQKNQK